MDPTTTDFKAIPVPVDHDARNLAIVYGSLGTLIAFASLIFAILSWMRSRHQRLATRQPSVDVELGDNPSQDTSRMPQELHTPESVSHNSHRQTTSMLHATTDTTRSQPLYELQGDATMPPHAHTTTAPNPPAP